MESVYVAMQRNLHDSHPLHVLLRDHFFHILGVNVGTKDTILVPHKLWDPTFSLGEASQQWVRLNDATFSFESFNMPAFMKRQGIDSETVLPHHLWRDDTLTLWGAIRDFVASIIGLFYKSDADVGRDTELANWIAELTTPRDAGGCGFQGLPLDADGKMTTVADATLFATMLVNNMTVNHSVAGNTTHEHTAFTPNMPGQFKLPVEELTALHLAGCEVTINRIFATLPPAVDVMAHFLGTYRHAQRKGTPLGTYSVDFFAQRSARIHLGNFQRALWSIEAKMLHRNLQLDGDDQGRGRGGRRGYAFLLPSTILMSVNM
jgi:arachidonate 15-lipoxygenase